MPPHALRRRLLAIALLLAGLSYGTASQALCVGVTVATGTTMQFLPYDPVSGTASDAVGLVTIGCAGVGLLSSFSVSLSIGTGTAYSTRQLGNGAARLNYNLYRDLDRLQIWGDGTPGTFQRNYNAVLSLGTVEYPVYGRIPARQDKPPGAYTSSITITIDL
jgi:spore coat protein U-like protein